MTENTVMNMLSEFRSLGSAEKNSIIIMLIREMDPDLRESIGEARTKVKDARNFATTLCLAASIGCNEILENPYILKGSGIRDVTA